MTLLNPTKTSLTPESDLPEEGKSGEILPFVICVVTIKTLLSVMITRDNIVSTEPG